jgi:hypothetical protein
MTLKPGVRLLGIKPEAVLALIIAESVFRDCGQECVVTSVVDGTHSRGSIHYQGFAFDLRTSHLAAGIATIHGQLKAKLGADFDVILEADHLHVEFDPKLPL